MSDITDATSTPTPDSREVIARGEYPTGTINPQDGFEIPQLKEMAFRFATEANTEGGERPIGWYIFFRRKITNEPDWVARKIEDIQIEELCIDETSTPSILRLKPLKGKGPKAVRLHQYDYASNYTDINTIRQRVPELVIQDASTNGGYGVEVLNGYRSDLRAAYMDYGTIMQIHRAYDSLPIGPEVEIDNEDENEVDNSNHNNILTEKRLRFIFTGAEINYGQMVSPIFQQERINDWTAVEDLDPSIASTLKIEPVYYIDGTEGLDGTGGRYESGERYPGAITQFNYLRLPGLFVLLSCKRYWEIVSQIQAHEAPDDEVYVELNKSYKKKAEDKNKKAVHMNFCNCLTATAMRRLVENGTPIHI